MDFGGYIRSARARLSQRRGEAVTQEDVERLIGLTKGGQYLSRWERGANLPEAWQVVLLIRALDLDEHEAWTLFGRAQARRALNPEVDAALEELGAALAGSGPGSRSGEERPPGENEDHPGQQGRAA